LERNGKASKDYNKENKGTPCDCGSCEICKLFGPHNSQNIKELRRLIFRDSNYLKDYDLTEEKIENTIDRITGTTRDGGLRKQERIIPGIIFEQEIIFDVYSKEDYKLFKTFLEGLKLLENDYLGGSGSRGYGKIKFLAIEVSDSGSEKDNDNGLFLLEKEEKEKAFNKDYLKKEDRISIEEVNKLLIEEKSVLDKTEEIVNKFREIVGSGKNEN